MITDYSLMTFHSELLTTLVLAGPRKEVDCGLSDPARYLKYKGCPIKM